MTGSDSVITFFVISCPGCHKVSALIAYRLWRFCSKNVCVPVKGRRRHLYQLSADSLLVLGLFHGLEVAIGVDLQFAYGKLVTDDCAGRVGLESGQCAIMRVRAFYGIFDGTCLLAAESEDDHFLCAEDCSHAYGEGGLRNLVHVIVEET